MLILFGSFIWYRRTRERGASSGDGEAKTSKRTYPRINFGFGTGPVTPHTPSLPRLPPRSQMIPVSPIESLDAISDRNATLVNEDSRVKLFLYTDADRQSVPESAVAPSEVSHNKSEMVFGFLPLYPPETASEDSFRRDSGQVVRLSLYGKIARADCWWPISLFPFQGNPRPLPRLRIPSDDHQYRTSLSPKIDLRNMRMSGDGRAQGFGPDATFVAGSNPVSMPVRYEDLPPPDYDQVVERFRYPTLPPLRPFEPLLKP